MLLVRSAGGFAEAHWQVHASVGVCFLRSGCALGNRTQNSINVWLKEKSNEQQARNVILWVSG